MKVVLASQNKHKLTEIQAILSRFDMELVLESELGLQIDVDETGTSFEENSELKARAVMEASGLPAIADDSGLCVDVLGGAPGIYSARYGAPDCVTDRDRLNHLLENMRGVEDAAPYGGNGLDFVIARPVRTLVVAIRIPRPLMPDAWSLMPDPYRRGYSFS